MGTANIDPRTCNNVSRHADDNIRGFLKYKYLFTILAYMWYWYSSSLHSVIVKLSFGGFTEYVDLNYLPFSDVSKRENRDIFCCFCDNTTIAINQPQQRMYLYLLGINHPHWADKCICTDFQMYFFATSIFLLHYVLVFDHTPILLLKRPIWNMNFIVNFLNHKRNGRHSNTPPQLLTQHPSVSFVIHEQIPPRSSYPLLHWQHNEE